MPPMGAYSALSFIIQQRADGAVDHCVRAFFLDRCFRPVTDPEDLVFLRDGPAVSSCQNEFVCHFLFLLYYYFHIIDRFTRVTEFPFVFGSHEPRLQIAAGAVQVPGHFGRGPSAGSDLFQSKIKQGIIVRFDGDEPARLQRLRVVHEPAAVGQAPFGVAALRPGITEVQIDPGKAARLEEFLQSVHKSAGEPQVLAKAGRTAGRIGFALDGCFSSTAGRIDLVCTGF